MDEFSHRPALSLGQVVKEIDQWLDEEDPSGLRSMLYLAGHGDMGRFDALDEPFGQGELAQELKGRLAGRVVHIGACNSASLEPSDADSLQALQRITRAAKVTGYTEEVDWVESVAFETVAVRDAPCPTSTWRAGRAAPWDGSPGWSRDGSAASTGASSDV